jgi:hypothetical protein
MSRYLPVGAVVAAILTAPWNHVAQGVYAADDDGGAPPKHCISTADRPAECFDTEAQALYAASGGKIVLGEGQTSNSLSDEELFAPEAGVAGVLYEHASYGGATLTLYGDGCALWNNMPGGWNDRTSSARTGSCGITLYADSNRTGTALKVNSPGTWYVGDAMNDKASSWSVP